MRSKPTLSNKLAALLVLLVMLACNVPFSWTDSLVPGGTWYVDKTGNDSNDCLSATSACLTITAAVSKALTAGVIQIGSGIFEEISTSVPETGLYINNKTLTFRGTVTGGAPETILSGALARTTVVVKGSAIIIFQDLIIQDGGGSGSTGVGGIDLKIEGSGGSTAGVSLTNVIIRNSSNYGLFINGRAAVTLDNVQVLTNRTYGLFSSGREITIKNSTFSGNIRGAIRNRDGGKMVITDTTISDNGSDPAAIMNDVDSDMRIERSTINGTALSVDMGVHPGGVGIFNQGTLTMVNSTVAANSGAGIEIDGGGYVNMTFSTVAENGDYGIHVRSGSFDMFKNIIENNVIQDCYTGYYGSHPFTGVANFVDILSDGSCFFFRSSRGSPDPYLGHLADNDGSTQTMALLPGSAAIDPVSRGIEPTGPLYTCPATDQRGIARPQGSGCDIGAYEYEGGSAIAPLEFVTPSGGATGVVPLYTDTPTPTPIPIYIDTPPPTPTATATATATPRGQGTPNLTLTKNANCRKGPGTVYETLTSFLSGQTLQVDGRNEMAPWWWRVLLPNSNQHCWISISAGTPDGDPNQLPVIPAPPIPTFTPKPNTGSIDFDNDGYPADKDCNDKNPSIHPGAVETFADGIDSNCNGDDNK